MIYEIRTYGVKVGSLGEVEKRYGEAYEHRKKYSELAAFFHTEIGPLNEIIHIWPCPTLDARVATRKKAVAEGLWPPGGGADSLLTQATKIVMPSAFSPMQ